MPWHRSSGDLGGRGVGDGKNVERIAMKGAFWQMGVKYKLSMQRLEATDNSAHSGVFRLE